MSEVVICSDAEGAGIAGKRAIVELDRHFPARVYECDVCLRDDQQSCRRIHGITGLWAAGIRTRIVIRGRRRHGAVPVKVHEAETVARMRWIEIRNNLRGTTG